MKLVVAVSGGVDSVVLLDMLMTGELVPQRDDLFQGLSSKSNPARVGPLQVVVAHFDHGIREDSAEDVTFVAGLAERYGCIFETRREELGVNASEELARIRRYAYLRAVAKKHDATIVTAHHMNDIAETIVINLTRGTGWRGVAVLASDVYRPLLGKTKADLVLYAREHGLAWREDSTNVSDIYLRNRLRPKLTDEDMVRQLAALRARQVELRSAIDRAAHELMENRSPYRRYFFTNIDRSVALELLRAITEGRLTRPQLEGALLAIATYLPGKVCQAGAEVEFHFTSRHFTVQMVKWYEVE